MDIALIIIGSIFLIVGLIGCIVPILPGPPLSYVGLIILEFNSKINFSWFILIITGIIMIIATILDYYVPIWGTKKVGGTKWGIRGCAIGLIIGLFFGIWGVLFFPFLGAFVGEIVYFSIKQKGMKKMFWRALKSATGSFLGLMCGIAFKLAISCFIAFICVKEIIISYF
ncbi:MAG: DUF456 domain-containing protein [Bacteroidales bacterium]|jgi:uncharacterized protein YqgC (DUF456 family)|nr:DUF456 domain-containing protein [Bacteroidales bacterium]